MSDARVGAWIAAHENLVAADKVITEHGEAGFPIHAMLVGRADVYARMATADAQVGTLAGQYIYDKDSRQKARHSALKDAIMKAKGQKDDAADDAGLHTDSGDDPEGGLQDSPEQGSDG